MTFIYEPGAYGPDPVADCFWSTTAAEPDLDQVRGDIHADVAIIGAGFTGLSAAHHLGQAGVSTVVLDTQYPTFGATGRNGGFCCLGGGKITNRQLETTYGTDERKLYRQTEVAAVENARRLIDGLGIDVDMHSNGETVLAHSAQRAASLITDQIDAEENYGVAPTLHSVQDLENLGMVGCFFGGMTTPIGFALNPRKYALGLMQSAQSAGVGIYAQSAVERIDPNAAGYTLHTSQGKVHAKKFILATNGYSAEDMPPWMRSRFLPVQSSVIMTEPISEKDQAVQGWTSDQMSYDTRFLLHYFRKLPDNRFLFGMRGGLYYTQRSEHKIRTLIRKNFETLFPGWRDIKTAHYWSGLVALNRSLTPYVGPIQGYDGGYAGFGYHGNGVAMATYAGGILADLVQERDTKYPYPMAFRTVPKRFPFGKKRRWLLEPIYRLMPKFER